MLYRKLGKTGMNVSAIGLGCVQIASSTTDYGVQIVQRALELGVNYLDSARGYGDSEIKVGIALKGQREKAFISTKTGARTRDKAWQEINESLERLRVDYVDNIHLHGLREGEDLEMRLGPGGALEALIQAREQGLTRHIGCTSHTSACLLQALKRFDFEIILVPMNIIERDPLIELIPYCQAKGVGVTIMKPVATGLLPAQLALKWLMNQPIGTAVPGVTTLAEMDEDAGVGHADPTLTTEELAAVQALKEQWEHRRCRICGQCLPCPEGISISNVLGTDVIYDHYRTMGPAGFRSFTWSRALIERDLQDRQRGIAQIEACQRCGVCEARCPHGLPIVDMLKGTLPNMRDMVAIYRELLG
jgi:uncharacterized protein